MEYFIGGIVVMCVFFYVKFMNIRTIVRNNDEYNLALVEALAERIRGESSDQAFWDKVATIKKGAAIAMPPVAGDVWSKRVIHVSSMLPSFTNLTTAEIKKARRLLYHTALYGQDPKDLSI